MCVCVWVGGGGGGRERTKEGPTELQNDQRRSKINNSYIVIINPTNNRYRR